MEEVARMVKLYQTQVGFSGPFGRLLKANENARERAGVGVCSVQES